MIQRINHHNQPTWLPHNLISSTSFTSSVVTLARPSVSSSLQITTALSHMHHLTCWISSLLHSVNLILFAVLLVHLILRISPHHSHHFHSHHLSLLRSFTPGLKLICFTNPFLHSLSRSIWTAFADFGFGPDLLGTSLAFVFRFFLWLFVFGYKCHVLD